MRRVIGKQLMGCVLLLFSLLGGVSSFQVHNTLSRRPTASLQSSRIAPSRLLAMKKWISLSPDDGVPRIFGIRLDDSIQDVDDLKKAIKNEAVLTVPADEIELEHPLGTVLAPDDLVITIQGGETKIDPIFARLPQPAKESFDQFSLNPKKFATNLQYNVHLTLNMRKSSADTSSAGNHGSITSMDDMDDDTTSTLDGLPDFVLTRYGFPSKLTYLTRKCYIALYKMIKKIALSSSDDQLPVMLITGVPGIGKSLFGIFFLLEAMLDDEFPFKEFFIEFEKGVYQKLSLINNTVEKSTFNRVTSVKLGIKVKEGLEPGKEDLIISDIKDMVEPKKQGKLLLILSSPNPLRFKQTMNAPVHYRLIMPTWSESEFEAFVGDKSVQWYDRFVKFGGVPRYVLWNGVGENPDQNLDDAIARKGNMVMNYFIGNGFGDVDPQKSYMLMHINPPMAYDGEFDYSAGVVHSFASDYIYNILQQKNERAILNKAISLFNTGTAQQTLGGSTAGVLFEKIVLWSVPLMGKTIELKGLTDISKRKSISIPSKVEYLPRSWKRHNDSTNFIPLLPGVLYLPRISNLQSADTFCVVEYAPGFYWLLFFQITVGEKHPVKANGLCEIIEAYSEHIQKNINQKIVAFIIPMFGPLCSVQPLHTVDDKVMQKIPSVLQDLEQYVCEYKLEA